MAPTLQAFILVVELEASVVVMLVPLLAIIAASFMDVDGQWQLRTIALTVRLGFSLSDHECLWGSLRCLFTIRGLCSRCMDQECR